MTCLFVLQRIARSVFFGPIFDVWGLRFLQIVNGWDAGSPKRWDRWLIVHPPIGRKNTTYSHCLLGGYILPTTFYGNPKQPLKFGCLISGMSWTNGFVPQAMNVKHICEFWGPFFLQVFFHESLGMNMSLQQIFETWTFS